VLASHRVVGTVLGCVFAAAAMAAPAQADLATLSTVAAAPGLDPLGTGLPSWYQDANGLQLAICEDGTPACLSATPATLTDPAVGEIFYNMATAVLTGPAGEKFTQIDSLQAGLNASGNPAVFQRVRARVQRGQPNATYTVVEPFGTQTITTNAAGFGTTTQDIGCGVVAAGTCDFTLALATGVAGSVGPLLTWDAGAPAGYVGDGISAHTIIGSPLGTNFFNIGGPGLPLGGLQTNTFRVVGKIAAIIPAFASAPVDFGDQLSGTASSVHTATIHDTGLAPLTITTLTLGGADPADFTIGADTCTGASVASGATCTVAITFTPAAASPRSATLAVADNAGGSPHSIALSGNGTTPPPVPPAPPAPADVSPAPPARSVAPHPAAPVTIASRTRRRGHHRHHRRTRRHHRRAHR
jgi:hypothetical protein